MVAQQCRGESLRLVSSRSATTTTLWDRGGDTGHRMGHRSSWPHLEEVDEEVGVGGRLLVVEEEAPVEGGDQQGQAGEGLQAGNTSCRLVLCEGWGGTWPSPWRGTSWCAGGGWRAAWGHCYFHLWIFLQKMAH